MDKEPVCPACKTPYSSSIAVLDLKMARHTNQKMLPVSGC